MFTEGVLHARQQAAQDDISSSSEIGVAAGTPIEEGFQGGDRPVFFHPLMCDAFRSGRVPCPWDSIFEWCPCVPRGHRMRHLRWSSDTYPDILPRWIVVNCDPIPLPNQGDDE